MNVPEKIDELAAEVACEWQIPGLAIGVVAEDEVVHLEGYGNRDIAQKQPVTGDTVFSIASSTKAITATGLGLLVDAGKLTWDTRLRDCLPWLFFKDPVANEYATVRDMLCHRTGLPGHVPMQIAIGRLGRREIVERIQHLQPSCEFRRKFQYQNQMYQVATLIIEEISGTTWEDFTKRRIFAPLGMSRSFFSTSEPNDDNVAVPCERTEEGELFRAFSLDDCWSGISGSGAVHSCARDMCQWLILNINEGKFGGTYVVSKDVLDDLQSPEQVIPGKLPVREMKHQMYGLGWNVMTYRGYNMLNRPGGAPGIKSQLVVFPEDGIGIVILSNYMNEPHTWALCLTIADHMLDLEPLPWLNYFRDSGEQWEGNLGRRSKTPEVDEVTLPTQSLEHYVGNYEDQGYGSIRISLAGSRLYFEHCEKLQIRHIGEDVFDVLNPICGLSPSQIRFERSASDAMALVASMEPLVDDIRFTKNSE